MERHRHIETLRSVSWAVLLLSAVVLIANNDPRGRRAVAMLTPSPEPSNDNRERADNRMQQTSLPATADLHPDDPATTIELIPNPVMPLSMAAIDLSWTPLQRYRFYCRDDRRYYPAVTRCRSPWQAALTVYQ